MIETVSNTSNLASRLRERIARNGPVTFCDWMKAALYDPTEGYYASSRSKWGRGGDYRTSPERSRMFAATFARYFAKLHDKLGRPERWTLLEVGAGGGHFAEGVLDTLQISFPYVFAATRYVIDEVSSYSRALTEQRLKAFADKVEFKAIDEVTLDPGVVFSNELLDAFPIHRVIKHEGRLLEFYVDVAENGNFEWKVDAPDAQLLPRFEDYFDGLGVQLYEGQVAEVSLEIDEWFGRVANSLRTGYVITVDYGAAAGQLHYPAADKRGTLRGFQRHQFVDDLLAEPGEHDLTTTLNWSFVKSVGERLGLRVLEFERQDKFLLAAGFLEQLEVQSQLSHDGAERLRLSTAAREMILPDGMAASFQVLVQQRT